MTTGMNFWDIEVWTFVLALAAIFVAMLVANLLIKVIKPLRRALVPAPVLGGFILLAFVSIYKAIAGHYPFNPQVFELLTYHCLGLGFVATALKNKKKKPKGEAKKTQKQIINASFATVSGYLIQAVVGLVVSIVFFFIMESWPASGLLAPMGFGQGPGQAFNWGNTFSQYTNEVSQFGAFEGGKSFGLTVAAMGFVAASIGGVIYLNYHRRKGNPKMVNRVEAKEENHTVEQFVDKGEIDTSSSIDKGSVQFGLILVVYAISFAFIYGVSKLCDISGVNLLINTVKPLFWGFNFIFGTLMAGIFKLIMNKLKIKGVIKKQYTNNYLLDRFSGLFFDIMVVAAIGAIDLSAFGNPSFIAPLIVMCVLAGVSTFFFIKHVCKHVFPEYKEEAFLAMYGMLCGTASTGVILLREIDPEFKTPACDNCLVYQPAYSILFGAPMLLSMGMAAKSWTSLGIWMAAYVLMLVAFYLLMRRDPIIAAIKRRKALKAGATNAGDVAVDDSSDTPADDTADAPCTCTCADCASDDSCTPADTPADPD